jgi:hypothetical protein
VQLDGFSDFASLSWDVCPNEGHSPFLPAGKGDYFSWPKLDQIFAWHFSGVEVGRNWCIAESRELLSSRWEIFAKEPIESLFSLSRDTHLSSEKNDIETGVTLAPIHTLNPASEPPRSLSYCFRSFDNQCVIIDPRFCNWPRPDAQRTWSENQIYFGFLLTETVGKGPAIVASSSVPDRNSFHGRSGRFVSLFRDRECSEPNLPAGLLDLLGKAYGATPSARDLAAYVYAMLGGQSYTTRFWNELETPGPRVPLTEDGKTFSDAAALGRRLIWLHTYAERYRGEGRGDEVPPGAAKSLKGVSSDPALYPEDYAYDPKKREVRVGDGPFGPVAPEVWEFEVSGLKVVQSWLGYRMKKRAGKKSSPLDDIRPERWTPRMTDEFLELLWVLEATLAMEPELAAVLDKVVSGTCFTAAELPMPSPEERKAPGATAAVVDLLALMEGDEAPEEEAEMIGAREGQTGHSDAIQKVRMTKIRGRTSTD